MYFQMICKCYEVWKELPRAVTLQITGAFASVAVPTGALRVTATVLAVHTKEDA